MAAPGEPRPPQTVTVPSSRTATLNSPPTATYRRYDDRCNDHSSTFPDYRWNLQHLLIDAPWISAHFLDTGSHRTFGVPGTGRANTVQEFAAYRLDTNKIAEVWVVADNLHLMSQLQAPPQSPLTRGQGLALTDWSPGWCIASAMRLADGDGQRTNGERRAVLDP